MGRGSSTAMTRCHSRAVRARRHPRKMTTSFPRAHAGPDGCFGGGRASASEQARSSSAMVRALPAPHGLLLVSRGPQHLANPDTQRFRQRLRPRCQCKNLILLWRLFEPHAMRMWPLAQACSLGRKGLGRKECNCWSR